jgi:hypothetical protein
MDIVIQGPIYPTTYDTAKQYLQLSFVERVIISTWNNESIESNDSNIEVVKSSTPEHFETMNYQIVSSFEGIKKSSSDIVAKTRSDQIISNTSIEKINNFVNKHIDESEILYSDGTKRKGNIFVIGMNRLFPFHPQDHLFWGYREDMYRLFDIPLKPEVMYRNGCTDFTKVLQENIYLGSMYFKQFYPEIQFYMDNFKEYLLMNSPKDDARIFSQKIRDKVFKVLPKFIEMNWVKYGWNYYPYSWYPSVGEYYYEDLYGPYKD